MTTGGWVALGAVFVVPGIVLLILSFAMSGTASAEDLYFSAPPCAAGVQPTGDCRATVAATMTSATHVSPGACNSGSRDGGTCWSLVFALAGGTTVTQNFDFTDYAGATSRSPVAPPAIGTVQIWSNRLVSFTWNGNVFDSTAYPLGSGATTALRDSGIAGIVLGAFCLLVAAGRRSRTASRSAPVPVSGMEPQTGTARQRLDALIAEAARTGRTLDPEVIHRMKVLGDEVRAEQGFGGPH